jgi:hypothetical protein
MLRMTTAAVLAMVRRGDPRSAISASSSSATLAFTYFTPTSSSWLNIMERFFRDLTQNRLGRGVFRDVEELISAIGNHIDHHNQHPKPFIWSASR